VNLHTAQFITSEEGQTVLTRLQATETVTGSNQLAVLSRLRKNFTPEIAGGLLEVLLIRQKAAKFSRLAEMFFTRAAYEQASSETVANYRANRMLQVLGQGAKVADLGCSCGGDLIALAQYFDVIGVDLDPVRLEFARANLAVYGRTATLQPLDINTFDPIGYSAIFFDPARRTTEGKRIFDVTAYQPPLSIIQKWLKVVPEVAVKVAPGVDYAQLADYDCEVEIISEKGDVKEAVLWFGKLRTIANRRATLLPAEITLTDNPDKAVIECGEPLQYLYEPDGAVIRAGLVEDLAWQMGNNTRKLDPDIAYLTSQDLIVTPFARAWRILEYQAWNLKKLNHRLQELSIGKIIVKKRGSPVDPQALEKSLKLKGSKQITVVLTHVLGKPVVLLCQEI
jgi:THUMP domain-like/RNA cap guanine-N2 methyltransferase